jgi:PhnB protein
MKEFIMARKSVTKNKKKQVKKKNKLMASKKMTTKKRLKGKKKKEKVSAVPKGYHSITPYLIVNNAAKAIDFYRKVFGAKVGLLMDHPGGKIGHAELIMGDAKIMLADEYPDTESYGPQAYGGSPVGIHLYIKNVDVVVKRAIDSGAKLKRPVENMFYGDRSAVLEDPYGHKWLVSTHVENVSPREVKKRAQVLFNKK